MLCVKCPEVGKQKFHRYSQEKTMNWLMKKVLLTINLYEIQTYLPVPFPPTAIQYKNTVSILKCAASHSGIAYSLFVDIGREDCPRAQEDKYLCRRGSQIYNVCQSEARVRPL